MPCTDQKQFWPFLERKKNIKQILVSNFLSGNCPLNHRITHQESGELSVDTHQESGELSVDTHQESGELSVDTHQESGKLSVDTIG